MKKITIFGLILLGLSFSYSFVSADVPPPGSHFLERCVKIVNLDAFPEISLIGYYTGPMIEKYEVYQIKNNECLTQGYKFNEFSIYWNSKDQIIIDEKNLVLKSIEVDGGWVDEKDPIKKENIEYSIFKSNDGQIHLQKTALISEYNNGIPNKVEIFPLGDKKIENKKVETEANKTDNLNKDQGLIQANRKGFWKSIFCFFNVSKNC